MKDKTKLYIIYGTVALVLGALLTPVIWFLITGMTLDSTIWLAFLAGIIVGAGVTLSTIIIRHINER